MEALWIAIGVPLALAALWAIVAWAKAVAKKHRDNLEAVAKHYGGVVSPYSFWASSKLHLHGSFNGTSAELSYFMGTDKAPPWTKLHINWSKPGCQLRVAKEGMFAKVKKFFGSQDIQIGDATFDSDYLIQGKPEDWVRRVLDSGNRQRVNQLKGLGAGFWRGSGISLDVGPAGVVVHCYRNLVQDRDQLLQFLKLSEEILRSLKGSQALEIKASAKNITVEEIVAKGDCPVCADRIAGRSKNCKTCNTAHHKECWDYLGGCAVFGCGEMYRKGRQRSGNW